MWYVLKRDMDKPSMEIIGRFKIPVNASEIMLKDVREYIDIPDEAMMEIRNGGEYATDDYRVTVMRYSAWIEDVCEWDVVEYGKEST